MSTWTPSISFETEDAPLTFTSAGYYKTDASGITFVDAQINVSAYSNVGQNDTITISGLPVASTSDCYVTMTLNNNTYDPTFISIQGIIPNGTTTAIFGNIQNFQDSSDIYSLNFFYY